MYPSNNGCPSQDGTLDGCCYWATSPIIVDVKGEGFQLSSPDNGVWFKVFPDREQQYMTAWPRAGSHNGWLVLDRNGNGVIDDFSEFFGNLTPQPDPSPGQVRNGFLALAVYDRPENGGNNDGWIDEHDDVYGKLRIWIDSNHDGVSQPEELHTLGSVGIMAISLRYALSRQTDPFGNEFRFRSTIRDEVGFNDSKVIYDVFVQLGAGRSVLAASRKSPIDLDLKPNQLRDLLEKRAIDHDTEDR